MTDAKAIEPHLEDKKQHPTTNRLDMSDAREKTELWSVKITDVFPISNMTTFQAVYFHQNTNCKVQQTGNKTWEKFIRGRHKRVKSTPHK